MKLYHGTSEDRWEEIRRAGLEPRGERQSQWEEFPSRRNMVYLSVVHPFYYGLKATHKGRCAVLEIDGTKLDKSKFHPDEDFIAQGRATQDNTQNHDSVRDGPEQYRDKWQLSLETLGSCCYKGTIPVSVITRVCLFDSEARPFIKQIAANPYNIDSWSFQRRDKRTKYVGLVAWFFGDTPELPNPYPYLSIDNLRPEAAAEIEQCRKESQDRTGIEIVELGELKR